MESGFSWGYISWYCLQGVLVDMAILIAKDMGLILQHSALLYSTMAYPRRGLRCGGSKRERDVK